MANQDIKIRVQYSAEFDISKISSGLKEIKKQISNQHIGEELQKQLQSAFNKLEVKLPQLEKFAGKDTFSTKELEQYQKLIAELQSDLIKFNEIASNSDFKSNFSIIDNNKLKEFDKQIQEVENKISSFRKEMVEAFEAKNGKTEGAVSDALVQLFSVNPDEIENKFNEIVQTASNEVESIDSDIEKLLSGKLKYTGKELVNIIFGDESTVKTADNKAGLLTSGLRRFIEQYRDIDPGDLESKAKLIQKVKDLLYGKDKDIGQVFNNPNGERLFGKISSEDLKDIENLKNHIEDIQTISKEKITFINEAEAEKAKITAEQTKYYNDVLNELVNTQKLTVDQAQAVAKGLTEQANAAKEGADHAHELEVKQKALESTFGSLAHRIESAVSAMAIFNKSMQIIRSAIKSVEDLDAAFTQIAIVSEQSGEAAWKMFDSFNSLAKQYSITTKDLTEGAKLFYQQGLSAADTMKMVEASTVSAALGEVSMTEAANTLTAAIQGYNESAAVAMDYTDKIAMVGAVSAADFNELSAAMEKTASSAYTAGIDFDHLLGYLGKMIEVTREAPANLGTAMKTIIARFEDMKKDPAKVLEDGVSFNKVEDALKTLGIAMRDTAGEFRPLQEVFDELGMKWETLTRNQQAYIATVAAGSRQQSRFLAMMNNYDRTLDLIAESQNSAGAAARQYATYQDSIAAAQARLTASWEKFYSKIVDNGAIKFAINGLSSLVDALSKVPPAITAIGVSIGAIELQQFLNDKGGLIKIITNSLGGGDSDTTVKSFGKTLVKKIYSGLKEGAKELDSRGGGWNVLSKAFHGIKKEAIDASKDVDKLGKTTKTLGQSLKEMGEKGKTAFRGILNFILDPKALGITAVIAAVALLIYTVNKLNNRANDAAKKIQELNNEIADDKQTLKHNEDLLKSYDDLVKKVNRTEEEQEQLNNLIDEIQEIYPNAITWMDQYGNMHLSNRDSIAAVNAELRENIRLKEQEKRSKQKDFLNETPPKQWTKENLTDAGFSSIEINRLLQARDNDKYLQAIEKARKALNKGDRAGAYNLLNSSGFTKKYNLDFKDMFAEEWTKENGLTRIKHVFTDQVQEIIDSLEENSETVEEVTKEMLHNIDIDELFDQYDVDGKHSAIITYYKMIVSSLPIEDFKDAEEEINDTIKKILQITDNDKIIEAFDLIKKFYNQEISVDEYTKQMGELGIELGESVANGYIKGINEKKEDIRQNTIQAVQDALGITVSNPDTAYIGLNEDQLQTRSDLANIITARAEVGKEGYVTGVEGSKILAEAAPVVDEINDLVKTSLESGSYEGFITGLNDIIQKLPELGLSDAAIDLIKDALDDAEQQIEDANLFSKVFDEAQTKIQDFMSGYKESMDSVLSGKSTKLSDTDMTTSDDGVYIDLETGEAMVSIVKTLSDLEKERSAAAFEASRAYSDVLSKLEKTSQELKSLEDKQDALQETGEELSQDEKERLSQLKKQANQLENQKSILGQQLTLLDQMKQNGAQAGWATSIDLAKDYQSNLKSIQSIQETIKEQGFLDVSDMETVLNIMPEYAKYFEEIGDTIAGVEGKIYTITEENIQNMMEAEKARYDYKLAIQQKEATDEYNAALADYNMLIGLYGQEADADYQATQEKITNRQDEVNATEESAQKTIELYEQGATGELQVQADKDTQMIEMFVQALQSMGIAYEEFLRQLESGEIDLSGFVEGISSKAVESGVTVGVDWDFDPESDPEKRKALIQAMVEEAKARMEAAWQKLQSLKSIDVPGLEKLKKDLEDSGKSGKELEKTINDITKAIEDAIKAAENLDKILKELPQNLKDIKMDYNPFTDLFEAWEHEWDYYYNIKRLISQIQTQGQFIDNIVSSDYASAEQKSEARKAQVGNLLAQMSANDAYITALRAGMAQTGVELMEKYGEYYKIDPETGQIYQTDKNLSEINDTINDRRQEIYDLQKLQNEKENDLTLENAKLDALEEEKSAYEEILSTIDSQLESLKENEDVTVDTTELENQKAEIEAKIEISEDSIEETKDKIEDLEDEIQEIEIDITLKEQEASQLEDYVSDMEDKVSEYEEYWENVNATIEEQQQLLQQLTEIRNYYIETAIATEQELYDAIVENYQKEIDEKKKQYDYLKKLDSDYLNSIKENINKEKQLREDANKQKSYQQNVQRAQLLQMDTSGAFRNELASLNKEIEKQREEFYDDLIQKQYDALENEIEKRHELYDKEVAALEERLAYMQENAFLLWESVNAIVASGTDAMMATLENTTNYINSNELARQQQRTTWEDNILTTFEGTQEGVITTLDGIVSAGNELVSSYPEVEQAIDDYKLVFDDAKSAIDDYTEGIKNGTSTMVGIFNDFMTKWNDATNKFTGYADSWSDVIKALELQTEDSKNKLKEYYDEEGNAISELIGSIGDYDEQIKEVSKGMYDDFISERERYRDELQDVIDTIQSEITAAIEGAAQAIQEAADNIEFTNPTPSNEGSGSGYEPSPSSPNPGNGNGEPEEKHLYRVQLTGYETFEDYIQNKNGINAGTVSRYSENEAIKAADEEIMRLLSLSEYKNWYFRHGGAVMAYARGGLANFTGPAWLDGTKSAPERILSPRQTQLFESMVSSLEKASNNSNINSVLGSSYKIGDINTNINVEKLDNETDIDAVARQVENRIMKSIRNRVSLAIA